MLALLSIRKTMANVRGSGLFIVKRGSRYGLCRINVNCNSSTSKDTMIWSWVTRSVCIVVQTSVRLFGYSVMDWLFTVTRPWFTKRWDVLPADLAKPRSREICVYIFLIALKFDVPLGNIVAKALVRLQSDTNILMSHLTNSRLNEM